MGGWAASANGRLGEVLVFKLAKGDVLLSLGVFFSLFECAALEGGSEVAYSREGLLQAQGPQGFQFLFVPWFPL